MNTSIEAVEYTSSLIEQVIAASERQDHAQLAHIFEDLEASEIAHLLESLPNRFRSDLWNFIPEDRNGDVLVELGEVARASLVDSLEDAQVIDAVSGLDSSDLAEVVETLPDQIGDAIRESLDYEGLQDLEAMLAFPEDSAGRLMETQVIVIRPDISLETVLRFLRIRESIPEYTDAIMVVDRLGHFLGELDISDLLTHQPDTLVSAVMDKDTLYISPEMSQHELVTLSREENWSSLPVVNNEGLLLGRVTVECLVDVMQEEADHQILGAVGLDEEEDLFSPIIPSAKRRLFWLGINLATAFLAAWVIGLFQDVLQQVVALAVLMPIVASMGGIAGSQTLTLMIRGIATGKISKANSRWLAYKEIAIAFISGCVWAIVVGAVSFAWFKDIRISMILAAAMIVNLLVAAICGYIIPVVMKRLGVDPALAGGVVLTTATDVIGFVSFLGLATIFLL